MLQRVQPEVGEVRGLGVTEDAEDAALVLEFVHMASGSAYRRLADSLSFKRPSLRSV